MRFRMLAAVGAAGVMVAGPMTPATSVPAPTEPRAARAGSVITLGQAIAPNGACGPVNATTVQTQVSSGPGYVTPIAGVITGFSYYASATAGTIRLVFLRPGSVAGHYDSIGYTSPFAVTASTLNTFPIRTKISAGVTLALFTTNSLMGCRTSGFAATDTEAAAAFDPVTESDFQPGVANSNFRVDLAVTMEPDADNDGYGDVTQDLCPTSDLTHASCNDVTEPDTMTTKKPAKRGTTRRIKAEFASTVPGSTFECSLDRRPFRPCTSPYRKKVRYGRHVLKVQAVGPTGLVDQTPASVSFKVLRASH